MQNPAKKLYAMQYHPEVLHTEHGKEMLHNFLFEVCGCTGSWTMANYAKTLLPISKKPSATAKSSWPFPAASTALSQQPSSPKPSAAS